MLHVSITSGDDGVGIQMQNFHDALQIFANHSTKRHKTDLSQEGYILCIVG
jgi:hypothetical protein